MTHACARSFLSTNCFGKQCVSCDRYVSDPAPLDQDLCWGGLARLMIRLPRCLGEDLEWTACVTETELRSPLRCPNAGSRCLNSQNVRRLRRLGSRGWSTSCAAPTSSREPSVGDGRILFVTLTPEAPLSRERVEPEHLQNIAGHAPT